MTGAYIPAKNDNQQLCVSFFLPAKQFRLGDMLIFRIAVPVGTCNDILSLNQQQYRQLAFSHLCISHDLLKKSLLTFCSPLPLSAFRSQIGCYTRSQSHFPYSSCPCRLVLLAFPLGYRSSGCCAQMQPLPTHRNPHTQTHSCVKTLEYGRMLSEYGISFGHHNIKKRC